MYKVTAIFILALSALATANAASPNDDMSRHQKCIYKCPNIGGDHVSTSTNLKNIICAYEHKRKDKTKRKSGLCSYSKNTGYLTEDKYRHNCPRHAEKICKKDNDQ